jgi:hypothetical protein
MIIENSAFAEPKLQRLQGFRKQRLAHKEIRV